MPPIEVILKRFELPDETRIFDNGRFDVVTIGGLTLGRATYEPDWKWSRDIGPSIGQTRCEQAHVGVVLSGHATVEFEDGRITDLTTGTIFEVPAEPHDSWVVGDEKYVSLHFLGAERYGKT